MTSVVGSGVASMRRPSSSGFDPLPAASDMGEYIRASGFGLQASGFSASGFRLRGAETFQHLKPEAWSPKPEALLVRAEILERLGGSEHPQLTERLLPQCGILLSSAFD